MARPAASLQLSQALRPPALPQKVPGEGRAQTIPSQGRGRRRCEPGRDWPHQTRETQAEKEGQGERGMDGEIQGI